MITVIHLNCKFTAGQGRDMMKSQTYLKKCCQLKPGRGVATPSTPTLDSPLYSGIRPGFAPVRIGRLCTDWKPLKKLNISNCRIISIFCQICTASVPEQTILRDYSVYSYFGIWSIEQALKVSRT